jgi:hypothetical protein
MKTKAFWLLSFLVLSGLLLPTPVYSQTSYVFGQAQFATGTSPVSVIVGDFNGDGRLDLAVANAASGTVSILLGKPDGTFAPIPAGRPASWWICRTVRQIPCRFSSLRLRTINRRVRLKNLEPEAIPRGFKHLASGACLAIRWIAKVAIRYGRIYGEQW